MTATLEKSSKRGNLSMTLNAGVEDSVRKRFMNGLPASCKGFVVVDIGSVLHLGCRYLTRRERLKYGSLAPRRRPGFLAARFALKKLYSTTENSDTSIGYQDIETVDDDMIRPCCYKPDASRLEYVSASHDRRYAIAVAGKCGVGVDVETMAEVLWKGKHVYMSEGEQRLAFHSNLGRLESAVRIWSAKEAAAKAFNLELADAWKKVTLLHVGDKCSTAEIQDVLHDVHHAEQNGHVFSFIFDQ